MFVLTFFLPTTIITWQTNESEHLKIMNYHFEFFQWGFKEIPICPKRSWFGCVFQINCLLSRRPKDQPCRRHFVQPLQKIFFGEKYVFVFFSKLLDIIFRSLRHLFFESLFNCWPINYLSQQLVFFPVSQYWFRDSVCTREEKMRIMSLKIKDMDSLYHGAKISIWQKWKCYFQKM